MEVSSSLDVCIPHTMEDHILDYKSVEIYRKLLTKFIDFIKKSGRFFRNFNAKSNNCSLQPMGINSLVAIPKFVASYLELENPEKYTGHCFRKSSVTALSDKQGRAY